MHGMNNLKLIHKFDIMTVRMCLLSMCTMICTVNLVRTAWCIFLCTHVSNCFTSICHCFVPSIHMLLQINQLTRYNSFTDLVLDVYMWLNMFRAPPRPSSGAYNCISILWFYRWSVVVAALLVVVWPPAKPRPTTCETAASSWLIYLDRVMMHGLANVKFISRSADHVHELN